MNVLVVHDYGPLGRLLLERLRQTPLQVSPLLISEPEKIDMGGLDQWVPEGTDLIVNALWMTDPEAAERDPDATHKAVFTIPLALAEYASQHDIALLQLSSCYVFDGRKQSAYITSNPGHPCNELGSWQWEAEQAIRALLSRHIILRTCWSLGRFIRKVQRSARTAETLALPGRCVGHPVTFHDLARVLAALVMQLDCGAEVWGTYQYAGGEEISLYELGLAIVGLPGIPEAVRIVDELPEWAALEPANACLNCTKIRNTFGIKQLAWRKGLVEEMDLLAESAALGS